MKYLIDLSTREKMLSTLLNKKEPSITLNLT